jgi:hypothetical protein
MISPRLASCRFLREADQPVTAELTHWGAAAYICYQSTLAGRCFFVHVEVLPVRKASPHFSYYRAIDSLYYYINSYRCMTSRRHRSWVRDNSPKPTVGASMQKQAYAHARAACRWRQRKTDDAIQWQPSFWFSYQSRNKKHVSLSRFLSVCVLCGASNIVIECYNPAVTT